MPRYTPDNCMGRNVAVYLDGEEQSRVLEADDDLGFVITVKCGDDGKPLRKGGDIEREIKLGTVRVTFPVQR